MSMYTKLLSQTHWISDYVDPGWRSDVQRLKVEEVEVPDPDGGVRGGGQGVRHLSPLQGVHLDHLLRPPVHTHPEPVPGPQPVQEPDEGLAAGLGGARQNTELIILLSTNLGDPVEHEQSGAGDAQPPPRHPYADRQGDCLQCLPLAAP